MDIVTIAIIGTIATTARARANILNGPAVCAGPFRCDLQI
jgi:hypothetical protein